MRADARVFSIWSLFLVRNDVKTGKKGLTIWIGLRVLVVCCGV